jgi:malonyl-ACP O-methyltransferase BioC
MKNSKAKIKRAFSRSASTYDRYSDVQREMAGMLSEHMPDLKPKRILELGCATGSYTSILSDNFPEAAITSVDFSEKMVETASTRLKGYSNIRLACKDAEVFLSHCDKSFDLITSNAAIHWFTDQELAFQNIMERLNRDGLLLCTLLGPATFHELGQALQHVLKRPVPIAALNFQSSEHFTSILNRLFKKSEIHESTIMRHYNSTLELLRQIKYTGTTGGSTSSIDLGKTRLAAMDQWFNEKYGTCRATYQVYIVNAST